MLIDLSPCGDGVGVGAGLPPLAALEVGGLVDDDKLKNNNKNTEEISNNTLKLLKCIIAPF